MPVAVPNSNSFYRNFDNNNRYGEYENKTITSYYNKYNDNNNHQSFSRYIEPNDNNNLNNTNVNAYINKLEQKNRRLENINDIFLNMLREQKKLNYERNLIRNHSCESILSGPYPYLSYDKTGNKRLFYFDNDSINNNRIINGKYKNDYLVPLFPNNNSIANNNRISYLLNNEKLKLFRNNLPYFTYNDNINNNNNTIYNIPQKVNSVQYTNKKATYKKFSSSEKIINMNNNNNNDNVNNPIKLSKKRVINPDIINNDIINEIKKMNSNLNKRLEKIEISQSLQKKDIDYLMRKTKNNEEQKLSKNKSDKSSSSIVIKSSTVKMSHSNNKRNTNKDSKKESNLEKDKKEEKEKEEKKNTSKTEDIAKENNDKKSKEKEESNEEDKDDEDEEDDEDDEEEEDDDDDDEEEKELAIKSFNSEES